MARRKVLKNAMTETLNLRTDAHLVLSNVTINALSKESLVSNLHAEMENEINLKLVTMATIQTVMDVLTTA